MHFSKIKFKFYLESLSTFILFHLLTTVLFQFILYWFNFKLSFISLIVPFFMWFFVDRYFFGVDDQIRRILTNYVSYILFITFFTYYYSHFIDISFDGNFYHADTMIQLVYGWNPVTLDHQYMDTTGILWGELYPKFTWIIGALFIKLTHLSSSGMLINALIGLSVFIKSYYFFKRKYSTWFALSIALVILFNPIFIEQFHSLYVDNVIAHLLVILILANLELMENYNYKSVFHIVVVSIILINIKFTSFAFAGLIDLSAFIYYLIKDRKIALKIVVYGILILSIGLFIGYRPYLVNLLEGRNIFWPLVGENSWVSSNDIGFVELENMRSIELFIYSITHGNYFNSLIDFTSKGYLYYDQRIGAMGMHFSKFLFLGPVFFVFYFVKKQFKLSLAYSVMFIMFTISIVFNYSMAWKLRYIPHFWLIVPLTILMAKEYFKHQIIVSLLFLLVTHQVVDMIYHNYEYNLWVTGIYKEIYTSYRNENSYDVRIGDSDFFKVIEEYRLQEYGVQINQLIDEPTATESCHRVDMYTLCFTVND